MKLSSFLTITLLAGTAYCQQAGIGKARISLPKVKGVLEVDVGNVKWETRTGKTRTGKEIQLRALSRPDHLLITAFLQKVKFPASAQACRAKWWPMTEKAAPMKRDQLLQYEKDGMAVVDEIVTEIRGRQVRWRSIHAYLGNRDLCAEVHLSKEQFAPEDEKLFDDVLAAVRLLPDESTSEGRSSNVGKPYLAEGILYIR
jgi:hypothetical protein